MLNGYELTWNYFAFSYPMVCILGLIQISGAVLLLFRRTTLLGALILLPVMTNIILINIFYEISAGAFVNSLIFTIGLVFLIALRWRPLFAVLIGYGRD